MSGNMSAAGATALRPTRIAPSLAAAGMLLLLLPLPLRLSSAEPTHGMNSANARFNVSMVVLPTFKVLEVTPVKGGHEYRVWTNLKSVLIKGREYRFDKIGETTLMVAGTDADGRDSLASAWQGVVGAMAATSGSAPSQAAAPAGDGSNAMRVTVVY
ncbi:hypothetical protein QFZ42_004665 [Variovorax paradoxus]|jgi:hypothetical protein|uniref:hypothetical protein n=1 Tax=Variovorax paradoxus TaxID=34073 RepID=UPI0027922F6E|nr:hypothetical protein [Variovorax paradoxus]MDQ0572831.1 hypothetical protein [Variovorax paradoxus]